jgi:hypothetical protein
LATTVSPATARAMNRSTGERVEHVEYDLLFDAIKRRVRRAPADA